MSKGLPKSLSRGSSNSQIVQTHVIKLRDVPIVVNGATGAGWGTVPIAGLPQGNICFLGCVSYFQLSTSSAGITDTFTGSYAFGTGAATSSTFSGTSVDIIPNTSLSAATSKVSPRTRATHSVSTTGTVFDNTDSTLKVNANVTIADASISTDSNNCFINGELSIIYAVLLDD